MKIAVSIAGAITEPGSMPIGHNHDSDGVSEPETPVPVATRTSATTANLTSTRTSMPSSTYCIRADTSTPT